MNLRRALLRLAACYPLSFVGMILGGLALLHHWLWWFPLAAFYWFFLSTLWHCYQKGNGGFALALIAVGLQAVLAGIVGLGWVKPDPAGYLIIMIIPSVISLVGLSASWEAYRVGRPTLTLGLAATGLALPGLLMLVVFGDPPLLDTIVPTSLLPVFGLQFLLVAYLGLVGLHPWDTSSCYVEGDDIGISLD